jgi:hypothetical protein
MFPRQQTISRSIIGVAGDMCSQFGMSGTVKREIFRTHSIVTIFAVMGRIMKNKANEN